MATKKKTAPEFVRWFAPLLEALRQLGGSAAASEAVDEVAKIEGVTDVQRNVVLKSGVEKFSNQVRWARQYLVWAGMIDGSKRGVWTLTPKGFEAKLTMEEAREMVRIQSKAHGSPVQSVPPGVSASANDSVDSAHVEDSEQSDTEAELASFLQVLRELTPAGFERICLRVLREAGFERLEVTGKSNDGGIDGIGVLQINDLVKFNVVFQCKKWINAVPPKEVRDLRGAMAGRAEKAIFLTTSTFTQGAKAEALRAGTDPIELVDGEKLLELFKKYEMGLKPRTVYDIDHQFFKAFD
ncbi:restriction endonuclease [Paracidovorax wautersii]|uniref:Restriction system protein n=1 Tax=Paracidovorax wautersii TaxID=1177982 RepID=A0A1I2DI23_9BURK|nr:restriction endonuclease [Paracidovorax wautersii]SFE79590.1 restriction system protein [Paracidovorax wautersii]